MKRERAVAVIEARMGSTRLPGKVLRKLGNKSILEILIERIRKSRTLDNIVVATTTNQKDDIIAELSEKMGVRWYRGSDEDVLDRHFKAARMAEADIIVRITADNPLIHVDLLDIQVEVLRKSDYDYIAAANATLGLGCEVFTFNTLGEAWRNAKERYQREHVTPYIYEHPEVFQIKHIDPPDVLKRSDIRLTIDTIEDLRLYQLLHCHFGDLANVDIKDVVTFLDEHSNVKKINKNVKQKRYKEIQNSQGAD